MELSASCCRNAGGVAGHCITLEPAALGPLAAAAGGSTSALSLLAWPPTLFYFFVPLFWSTCDLTRREGEHTALPGERRKPQRQAGWRLRHRDSTQQSSSHAWAVWGHIRSCTVREDKGACINTAIPVYRVSRVEQQQRHHQRPAVARNRLSEEMQQQAARQAKQGTGRAPAQVNTLREGSCPGNHTV